MHERSNEDIKFAILDFRGIKRGDTQKCMQWRFKVVQNQNKNISALLLWGGYVEGLGSEKVFGGRSNFFMKFLDIIPSNVLY